MIGYVRSRRQVRVVGGVLLVALLAPTVILAQNPPRMALTVSQCLQLPRLDAAFSAISTCKDAGSNQKKITDQTCLKWWRGWATSCAVPQTCSGQMDQYYEILNNGMGLRDSAAVSASAGRAEAVNAQIHKACADAFLPSLPRLRFPVPVLVRLQASPAAPGTTITLFGTDLSADGSFVGSRVVFDGSAADFSESAQSVSNTQLRVVVPSGTGTAQVHVETAGGNTTALGFTYKRPTITRLSPSSGGRNQLVTISGQGLGVKQSLDGGFVKFGDSVAGEPIEWNDGTIVIKAPADFGTGVNTDILLAVGGCVARESVIVSFVLPGCEDLVQKIVERYRLSVNPGFLSRQVQVIVRTSTGISNASSFTYRLAAENRR